MNFQNPKSEYLAQRNHRLMTLMLMAMVLLVLQLWLITNAIEDYMAAHSNLAIPTFLASVGCFLLNLRILTYLRDLDK